MHIVDHIKYVPLGNAKSKNRLAAVIPALNEELNIEALVSEVLKRAMAIVVDDGSIDNTVQLALKAGAFVVSHKVNKGYDASLETGILTAISLGCDFAVTMDADGQHDPSFLDLFATELEIGFDFVIGVREDTQRWSEAVFGSVGELLWGISDPLCGMKGYNLKILKNIDSLNTYKSIGTEIAVRGAKAGLKISQFRIDIRPRVGVSRFGDGIKANIRIIKALFLGIFLAKKIILKANKF
jgi:glycosyltransferase involved in cell wall biosynthesis